MATTKITVTVPEDLAAYIRERVAAGEFESISAFMTRAGETLRDFDPLDLLIASMVAETGEPTAEDEAWIDAVLEAGDRADRATTAGPAATDTAA